MLQTCWRPDLTYGAKLEKCPMGKKACQTPRSDTRIGIGWKKGGEATLLR